MRITASNIKYVTALAYNGAIYAWSVALRSGGTTEMKQYISHDSSHRSTAKIAYPKEKLPQLVQKFLNGSVREECSNKDGFSSYIFK